MVSDDPTAPQPLTSDEQAEWKAHFGKTDGIPDHAKILRLIATVEEVQAEVDRLTADLATATAVVEAAEALCRLHTPYGAYVTWRANGDSEAADKLLAFDLARLAVTEALAARARAAQPQEGTT